MTDFHSSPFFWAFVSMIGLHGATFAVSGHRIGHSLLYILSVLTLFTTGRVLLVLPFCSQPRLESGEWRWLVGGLIVLVALVIAAPALSVRWWRPPAAGMRLRTTGIYSVVRHPIYLCEVLWPAGWSLMWGSVYGLVLTPVWWLLLLLHAIAEEEQMERVVGTEYAEYKERVRGRIFPGVPV